MQLLSVSLKSRPYEPESVGFEKLLTKILKCINRSVFEQIMNFFFPRDWKFLWKNYIYIFVLFLMALSGSDF